MLKLWELEVKWVTVIICKQSVLTHKIELILSKRFDKMFYLYNSAISELALRGRTLEVGFIRWTWIIAVKEDK